MCSHPELSAAPAGVYLYSPVAGSGPADFPLLYISCTLPIEKLGPTQKSLSELLNSPLKCSFKGTFLGSMCHMSVYRICHLTRAVVDVL